MFGDGKCLQFSLFLKLLAKVHGKISQSKIILIYPPTTPNHPSPESEENNFGLAFAWQFSLLHFIFFLYLLFLRRESENQAWKENNTKISKSHWDVFQADYQPHHCIKPHRPGNRRCFLLLLYDLCCNIFRHREMNYGRFS